MNKINTGTSTTSIYSGNLVVNGSTSEISIKSKPITATSPDMDKILIKVKELQKELNKAKDEVNELLHKNKKLNDLANSFKKQVLDLKSVNNLNLTTIDLKFILSKIHPDKNPGSTMANQLTTKIIKMKRKHE